MKKAVAFAGGAYLAYKAKKKLKKKFKPRRYRYRGRNDVDFDEWEDWREIDGMLCRDDNDCNWLDPYLGCNDYGFRLSQVRGDWPWKYELKGKCACSFGLYFDGGNGECRRY